MRKKKDDPTFYTTTEPRPCGPDGQDESWTTFRARIRAGRIYITMHNMMERGDDIYGRPIPIGPGCYLSMPRKEADRLWEALGAMLEDLDNSI